MKKSGFCVLLGTIVLIIGSALFGYTALRGATGFHSGWLNIGFDENGEFSIGGIGRTVSSEYVATDYANSTYAVSEDYAVSGTDSKDEAEEDGDTPKTEESLAGGDQKSTWRIENTDKITSIIIGLEYADVTLKKGDEFKVTAQYENKVKDYNKVEVYTDANSLNVEGAGVYENEGGNNYVGSMPNLKATVVTITIPDTAHIELISISSEAGDIKLEGLSVIDLYVNNSAGDVTLTNLSASSIDITMSAGEADLENVTADYLNLNNELGSIDVSGTFSTSYLSTSLGDIDFEGVPGEFNYTASMGDVDVDIYAAMADYSINADTDLGEIDFFGSKSGSSSFNFGSADAAYNGLIYTNFGDIDVNFDEKGEIKTPAQKDTSVSASSTNG